MHPVIIGSSADFEKVRNLIGKNAFVTSLYERAVQKAESMLKEKAQIRYLDEINLDAAYNLERLDILSFVYLISGDKRYLARTLEEMDAVCELGDWQVFKFLNTAGFGMGVAIAYDRVYEDIDSCERKRYREVLKQLLLKPAEDAYNSRADEPFGSVGWSKCRTNWNAVCNGAVIAAAAAIYDDEPEYAAGIIKKAVDSIRLFLEIFEPYGAFEEGISYWLYANLYLSKAVSALNNQFGNDGDILSGAGFKRSLEYAEAMNHGAYNFNFHDVGTERRIDTSALLYYAYRLGMPELGINRINAFKKGYLPVEDEVNTTDMLWYKEEYSDEPEGTYSKDEYFEVTEMCILQNEDTAVALHGGANDAIHGHLDNGTVILDHAGKRWLCDLGKDMYTYTIKGSRHYRWDLYRMRPEGHNCLVINPVIEPGQALDATAKIIDFESGIKSRAKIDLTSSYENADSITREVRFDKGAGVVEIIDDIRLFAPSQVYSFWHTRAEVRIDGVRARLKIDSGSIDIECNYPLAVMKAEPMDTSPKVSDQAVNDDTVKLYIRVENVKETQIRLKINLQEVKK